MAWLTAKLDASGSGSAELLGRIVDNTADHCLVVEPQVIDQQRSMLPRKPASSPYSIVISPYADDDASLRVPITMPVVEVVHAAMNALDSTSGTPLGEQWRARIDDTYVPPRLLSGQR
jgi:hypothetical protein